MIKIIVIIPAYNEEKSIGKVIKEICSSFEILLLTIILLIHSTLAKMERQCQRIEKATVRLFGKDSGIHAQLETKPDIVVFLDVHYSDYPDELTQIVKYWQHTLTFVIGARVAHLREKKDLNDATTSFGTG
jgi:cellulose synthase/poly-beta-1,6-N-acetylglucosamine synthase-like glycosyltransferase